jgi:hypothetical protein
MGRLHSPLNSEPVPQGRHRQQQNQERLKMLSKEAFIYEVQAEIIEWEVTARKARGSSMGRHRDTGLNAQPFMAMGPDRTS